MWHAIAPDGRALAIAALVLAGAAVAVPGCDAENGSLLASSQAFVSTLVLLDASGQQKTTFQQGESIILRLTVTNRSSDEQTVTLPSARVYDFVVADATGAGVWRWSQGRMFAQVVTRLEFAPGQKREFTAQWSQTDDAGKAVPAGAYRASGRIDVDEPGLASDSVSFEIQ